MCFFTCCPYVFFKLVFIFSFIYLFCDINIQVPEMDEEARLASELKKLEKEQERKKKELEQVEKRKKDQHAKAASRHISICFVIVFSCSLFCFQTAFVFFPFLLSVNAFAFSLSPRSSKRICAISRTSRWKWIPWSPSWPTIWKSWLRRRKSMTMSWKPWKNPGQFFFIFYFSNIFQKTKFRQSKFHQSFDETLIISVKVLSKLWLNFDSAIKV